MTQRQALRHTTALALGVLLAAILASVSLAGAAGPSARNGKLAYTVVVSALQLYLQSPDGDTATRLLPSDAVDFEAVASPDGTRIAFVSTRDGNDEIYVANVDGSPVVRLTRTPQAAEQQPAWSPDSRRIAFVSFRTGDSELYVVGADGRGLTRLTFQPGADDESPSWSPDGAQIAFDSDRDDDWDVYVMNADGTGTATLTGNDDADDVFPTWSPDGSRIAFTSDRDRQGDGEIFAMNADGTNVVQLTATGGAVEDWWPSWSPDGARIAFVSDRGGDEDVFVMNADGKAPLNVTDNEDIADADPSWAPDGRILFTSERAATFGIQATDLGGARRIALAKAPWRRVVARVVAGRDPRRVRVRAGGPVSHLRAGDGLRRAAATADAGPGIRRHVPGVGARRATHCLRSRRPVRHGLPLHDECRRHRCAIPARGPGSVLSRVVARRDAPCPRAELGDRRRGPKRAGTPTRHGRGQQLLADVVAGRSLDRLRVRP